MLSPKVDFNYWPQKIAMPCITPPEQGAENTKREIFLEYLPEEKCNPLGTTVHMGCAMVLNPQKEWVVKRFTDILKKVGLPHFRFHDLRHYCASIRHALGIPDAYIMQHEMQHKNKNP